MTPGLSVAVVMPIRDWVHPSTNRSILRMRLPPGTCFLDKTDAPVEAARNILTEGALKDIPGLTHLLFIDDDMIFEPGAFDRLLAHDLPIVGGLCHNRRPPYMPILMRSCGDGYAFMYDYDREVDSRGLVEVDATGCAFLLVKREVFEKIGEKPFTQEGYGEDVAFCRKAKAAGYTIHVDPTVEIGHVGEVVVNSDFARRNRDFVVFPWVDPAKRPQASEPGTVLPPARMRGDEITLEARRARARYALAGKEIAKRVRVGEALDFGCGAGYGCPIIARETLLRGSNIVIGGCDPDPLAITFGSENFWVHLTTDIDEALATDLAAITCFNVLQHVDDPDDTLRLLISKTRTLIGSVPRAWYEERGLSLPGSVGVIFYGQRGDGSFGAVEPGSQDVIFVISR